ncbi:short chain dehydrogenase/reductase [Hyaloscypha variabilis F]|uniref:Short chain dehydrogenase/reductase n=1 Tax=Hyaloscypha variabilis (strain UAMH 11265 / GT02V1 / F) TaxID=1149755 RepID=A0A2J6R959_HYAVF|nr:short chain dehydrogenase/reductase [Hyaloscypha variabilis F]
MSSLNAASLFNVEGLVVVITGGGSGIGLMMAKGLEENGAKVYIVGRRLATLEAAEKQAKHGNIISIRGDITKKEDLTRIVDLITARDGLINVLITNAGTIGPNSIGLSKDATLQQFRDHHFNADIEAFTNAYHVNATAVHFSIFAFLGLLGAGNAKGNVQQQSQVILTVEGAAEKRVPLDGFAYPSSKAAATQMMKQLSKAFVSYDIRVNVIAPGSTSSPICKFPKSMVPLQRAGNAEDMAGLVLFLTSKAGAYLSGSVIVTDGGRLSVLPSSY